MRFCRIESGRAAPPATAACSPLFPVVRLPSPLLGVGLLLLLDAGLELSAHCRCCSRACCGPSASASLPSLPPCRTPLQVCSGVSSPLLSSATPENHVKKKEALVLLTF